MGDELERGKSWDKERASERPERPAPMMAMWKGSCEDAILTMMILKSSWII